GAQEVAPVSEVQAEALVVGVLPIQARWPDVTKTHQVRVGRLVGKDAAQLRLIIQGVAAAEAEADAGPVHIAIRLRQDGSGPSLERPNRTRVDVPIDAGIDADAKIQGPAGFTCLTLRTRISRTGEQRQCDHRTTWPSSTTQYMQPPMSDISRGVRG